MADEAADEDTGDSITVPKDVDESPAELSYADLLDADESDISGLEDESASESDTDTAEQTEWDIPDDFTDETSAENVGDREETGGPSITGEYDIDDMDDEEPDNMSSPTADDVW